MQNAAADLEHKVEATVQSALQTGLFTSCYFECGKVGAPEPYARNYVGCGPESLFDLASMTKALGLGPLIFRLSLVKGFDLEAPLGDWIPSLPLANLYAHIKVRDLLGHRSGLPAWRNFWIFRIHPATRLEDLRAKRHAAVAEVLTRILPLVLTPGADVYSDVGMILLGFAHELITGEELEESFTAYLGPELARSDAVLLGPRAVASQKDKVIPTSYCPLRERHLKGEVHDENAFSLGGFMGHAGLFGAGPQVGNLLRCQEDLPLFSAYFAENRAALTRTSEVGLLGLRRSVDSGSKDFAGGQAMGHHGFTGTTFWIDPKGGTYVVLLTNRVISGRISAAIQPFRARVLHLVSQALG